MRHFDVRVQRGTGQQVIAIAEDHDVVNVAMWPGVQDGEEIDLVSIQMENRSVGPLLKELASLEQMSATLYPHEVLDFSPPAAQASKAVKNLENRSPLEIFLLGLQSIGSWGSFLAYAVAGATIAWIALFTNTVYLLIAAMLIAPFAGPAMNVAMATAVGDKTLFRKNITRYFAAILATMAIAAALSLVFQQTVVTDLMGSVGQVSMVAALLPLAAGGAGALNLIQSERSSLVSGTAVGMLVTASLAPPAAVMGVTLVMGNWNFVTNAGFLLLLQLVGINLAGSVVFRAFGLTSSLSRYQRGQTWVFYTSLAVTLVALVGLLTWQFSGTIRLQRSSQGTRATQAIREIVQESGLAQLVEVEASYQTAEGYGSNTLLANVYVQRPRGSAHTSQEIQQRLRERIQRQLQDNNPQTVPLINLTVLEPPPNTPTAPQSELESD